MLFDKLFRRPAAIDTVDYVIVGAGVVGLAVARALAESAQQARSIVVLERENGFGRHTSSRNSEVLHAGIYYPQGSAKAEYCVRGREMLVAYSREKSVPFSQIGKLIVAQQDQLPALDALRQRAENNGVENLRVIERALLSRIEPAVSAHTALFSPSTCIIDSHALMQCLLNDAERAGALYSHSTQVESAWADEKGFVLSTTIKEAGTRKPYALRARVLINCAGLGAQELATMVAESTPPEALQIPELAMVKGSYFDYGGRNPFSHLIYPLPDTQRDALGIHATSDLSGALRFGPDAQPCETLDYAVEADRAAQFASAIRQYFPAVDQAKLTPSYAGIRPKLRVENGDVSDFVIRREHSAGLPGLINLFGIESPGLTSSLAIAQRVQALVEEFEQS